MNKSKIQKLLHFSLIFTVFIVFTASFNNMTICIPMVSENMISEQNPNTSLSMLNGIGGKLLSTRNGIDPKLCSDDSGGAIICWSNNVQRINNLGESVWPGAGLTLAQSLDRVAAADICKDGEGGAIITWHGEPIGQDYKNIYAQKVNSTGDFQWPSNWIPVCTAAGDQATPRICSDGEGGAIIIWRDYRVGLDAASSDCDVYAQRFNSSGQGQWTHNGILIAETNSQMNSGDTHPRLISDGEGGAIISWEDTGKIYAQKVNSTGDIQWTLNGLPICGATGSQERPKICSDGLGGAYFAWEDDRPPYTSSGDVYAQKVNSTGDLQWHVDGVAIMNTSAWQAYVELCNDGFGNVIFTWFSNLRILTQKFNVDGIPLWETPGIEIGISTVYSKLGICTDGAGGSFIIWRDFLVNNLTIQVQHINSIGALNWNEEGYHMRHTDAYYISMINDEYGGCIIAFSDYRSDSDYYIYTQIIKDIDDKPVSNNPDDVIAIYNSSRFINWTLQDDYGGGKYRVLTNNSAGDVLIWVNWTSWISDEVLEIPVLSLINEGTYFYTIEYYDHQKQLGLPDTVLVHIESPEIQPDPSASIPGYDIILFYAVSILITIVVIKRRVPKHLKKNQNSILFFYTSDRK